MIPATVCVCALLQGKVCYCAIVFTAEKDATLDAPRAPSSHRWTVLNGDLMN